MITKNNENTNTFNRVDESAKLLEMFKTQAINIKPMIPEGSHKATFNGWDSHIFNNSQGVRLYEGFQIKLIINGTEYKHDLPFSAKTAGASQKQFSMYTEILRDIGRQFALVGDVYIDDINAHKGQTIDLHVIIKDGKRFTNFYKAKEITKPTETPKF